ncbi:MAG TPA: SAM-dependent chlorinase/fluorinase [Syntrophorhabdales bacterium]|nr:SAM-dependent chlorinase/fluorinase [Syntrophorhabdales bacterium]
MKVITLLTDFGVKDPYVGVMKGVILSINPDAHIVDITHEIEPQDVTEGSFLIRESYPFFSKGSVHVCVVDPTVGSNRRAVALEHDGHFFVGPDNGMFSPVIDKNSPVYQITNKKYMRREVSGTFHGRDIFAPVAAHLSLGLDPAVLGRNLDDPVLLSGWEPTVKGRTLTGKVVRFDRFGNALSNITVEAFNKFIRGRRFQISLRDMRFKKLSRSYYESPVTCVVGSSGNLEFGLFKGNLAQERAINKGDRISVTLLRR